MQIRTDTLPWPISRKLITLLEEERTRTQHTGNIGVILNFRDPDYSPERGGYHPVEIAIGSDGIIDYITDFAYYGRPPHCELAKEIDFDFSQGLFQHFGTDFPIRHGRQLYALWESNFLSYQASGVYTVSAEPMG